MPLFTDIYFKCPCCRKPLVVERAAAGGEAPCPGCRASVRIPRRSGLPPKIVRAAGLAALNLAMIGAATAIAMMIIMPSAETAKTAKQGSSVLERALAARRGSPPPPLPFGPARSSGSASDELHKRYEALQKKNLQLTTQFEGMAQWVLDNYEGKYPLPLTLISRLNIPPVDSNYFVTGEIAGFLKMTPDEKSIVNDALATAREKMTRTEFALASVAAANDNSIKFFVPPYEQQGAALRQDLYASLESTLGGPRFDKFTDVTKQGLDEAYHYFGTAAREMLIEVVPQQGSDPAYLLISDGWQIPEGESVTRYSGKQTATREIPREYSTFTNVMPPNIAAFPIQQDGG